MRKTPSNPRGPRKTRTSAAPQSSSSNRYVGGGIALLAGAGIGMAMMYLLDPEAGEERRRVIAKRAGQATLGAREVAESAMEKLADATSGMRSSGASAISSGMSNIGDASSGIFEKLRSGAGGMTSQALSAGESLYE